MLLVFPHTAKYAVVADVGQRYGMNADHQLVVTLVLFNHLQRAGLVGLAAVERVAQQQQHGFATRKVGSLPDGMPKAAFLALVDIV